MDPAFPSMPPPGPDDGVKPMTFFGAALWAIGAQLAAIWLVAMMMSVRESAGYDLFGQVICQAAAFLLTLYLLLRFYAPED